MAFEEHFCLLQLVLVDRPHEFDQPVVRAKYEVVSKLRMNGKSSDVKFLRIPQLDGAGLFQSVVNSEEDIV